ncbi:MAG TPA: UDP-N-acetylmuramoyl-L-alanine--D-glutamate ligase, partial [Alphaproteobacteria bacterium]|nr:UDP-N-acetylmuramoyl-L-alanine--D-glutamate ligase [Alphaproteobacteria bacterium]
MIVVEEFAGRSVAVLGLGQSGMSAVRALAAGGADVRTWDDDARVRHAARAAGLTISDPGHADWGEVDALVASPGVALHFPEPHPAVRGARAAGVPVIGDIELFVRALPKARIAGITGTNGKSTTTALLGHILATAGYRTEVGANLGTPVLDLDPVAGRGVYILELSSYQLDLADSLACEVALLLNLSPDHLDRHDGMAGYADSKKRIFAGQREGHTAIVGVDDSRCRAIFEELRGLPGRRVVPVSVGNEVEGGIAAIDGIIYDRTAGEPGAVADLSAAPSLRGPHNMQNAACAYAAARALGLSVAEAAGALVDFPGLDHRMQEIANIDGIRFINDSKATNPEAAARALATHENIYWIVGGRAKEGAGL